MRIKKYNESVITALQSLFSKTLDSVPSIFTMDTSGYLTIEGFKKLNDYTDKLISLSAGTKLFYVHGGGLKITSCNRYNIVIFGDITSLEIFEVK
ncbi:MAG: YabP/YqfC family sporulation protein [Oscillospiraceae bacterium]